MNKILKLLENDATLTSSQLAVMLMFNTFRKMASNI